MADQAAHGVTQGAAHGAPAGRSRAREVWAFVFLTVVLWPVLAIAFVGGWGLVVWIYQLFAGPPTG